MLRLQAFGVLLALLAPAACWVGAHNTHTFKTGDPVTVWVNKVGPYNNPQEIYNYYYLPFCKPKPHARVRRNPNSLGNSLQGNELIDSGIDISFQVDTPTTQLCNTTLDASSAAAFHRAVRHNWWFEFFIDELPVWGFIGETEYELGELVDRLYTHKTFEIAYNGKQVISITITPSIPMDVKAGECHAVQCHFKLLGSCIPACSCVHHLLVTAH